MDNYQIFISYRRDGGDALAGRLADRFNALGYKVFYDVESMRSGTFNTQILDAIVQCSDVLLVLPPNALDRCINEDDWVRQELAFALKHNKNIIPIMMRGFEFPKVLPADIDSIRNMEGVTASSEYFDAVIDKIKSLLSSSANKSSLLEQKLETKEYYQINTPLFNIYKRNNSTPKGYLNVAVFTEKLFSVNSSHFHWKVPVLENSSINSLRDFMAFGNRESVVKWYDKNKEKIENLRNITMALKTYKDLYFYNNCLIFAMGSLISLPSHLIKLYPSKLVEVFCYCLDLPTEMFGQFEKTFDEGKYCYEEFGNYLPLPFDVWTTLYQGNRVDSDFRQSFDAFAILLFDFMIELSILILDTCRDSELTMIRTGQIRCYYKHLRKRKIYLPKDLQEKIYRYL